MSAINQTPGQIFPSWENNLEKEPMKPAEIKKTLEKIEYKVKNRVRKEIEVRSYVIQRKVTKEYLERQAKMRPFGIGTSEDDLRQNVNLTSIQRENVWHPYYEVKTEEEDFKDKLQRQKREKKETDVMGGDIAEIEGRLKTLEERERQEQQQLLDAASASLNPDKRKAGFDLKKLQDKKREEEKVESSVPQDDPYTVKLRGLTNDITEEEIWETMK